MFGNLSLKVERISLFLLGKAIHRGRFRIKTILSAMDVRVNRSNIATFLFHDNALSSVSCNKLKAADYH